MKSSNSGNDWSTPVRLDVTPEFSCDPDIAVFNKNVYVVWSDLAPGNFEIYGTKSTNNGDSWPGGVDRISNTAGSSYNPTITAAPYQDVYIAWSDDSTPGNFEIYYDISTDGGVTWQGNRRLTYTSGRSDHPDIQFDYYTFHLHPLQYMVHLVWDEDGGHVYYNSRYGVGLDWLGTELLTDGLYPSWLPVVDVFEYNIHVVWAKGLGSPSYIYHARNRAKD